MHALVSTRERNFLDLTRWSALIRLRRIILRFGNPTIEYEFYGSKMQLPLSHDLPLNRRSHPHYSDNLGRLASAMFARFGEFAAIDIGANVGDSVAIIQHYAPIPILCIEGAQRFFELLAINTEGRQPTPVLERCFVGMNNSKLVPIFRDGTSKLVKRKSEMKPEVWMKPLEQILRENPDFENARLLKIDTDGMDIVILESCIQWISRRKPVLFFEYDPDLQQEHDVNGLTLLRKLEAQRYNRVLIYDSHGELMFSTQLCNHGVLAEVHEYFSGRSSLKYCDLCVFHENDDELAEAVRQKELAFFRGSRHFEPGMPSQSNARL